MKKEKSQTLRIIDGFVTATVIAISATLVASGVSISRINTEYLETGVRAAKIVAARESKEIFLSESDAISLSLTENGFDVGKVIQLLPPPINTVYLTIKEFENMK